MAEYTKTVPTPDVETQEFWDGCKQHKLVLQKCDSCGSYRYPPLPVCPKCYSTKSQWTQVSGKGEVYTFVIVRMPLRPSWQADVPYVLGVVQLDEGPRMLTNVIGCKPEDVKIGMKVQVAFDDVTPEVTLAKFKPA